MKGLPISFNTEDKKIRMTNQVKTAITKRPEVRKMGEWGRHKGGVLEAAVSS